MDIVVDRQLLLLYVLELQIHYFNPDFNVHRLFRCTRNVQNECESEKELVVDNEPDLKPVHADFLQIF
jgi:hypothetical protein